MTDPVSRWAREAPGGEAIRWADGSWSWAELDAAANAVARRLGASLAERPSPAERPVVAAFLPPTPAAVAALHGVLRAGAVLAPLHRRWTPSERGAALERLAPALLLVPGPEAGRERPDAPPALTLEEAAERPEETGAPRAAGTPGGPQTPGRAETRPDPGLPPARTACILSTSGTAGRARLVALTERNLEASVEGVRRALSLGAADRWLASLAFSHVGGLVLALRAATLGSLLVLPGPGPFDPPSWSRLLREHGVTHVSLVPTMLRRLLGHGRGPGLPASLRCLLLGGAAVPPPLLERALEASLPVATTYGLTETASQVATAPPALVRRKPGTVGPPLPGTDVRISEEGEILVRGPTVMAGYWDEPADDRFSGPWLRTGDLGRLDAEGDLWVEGRRSGRIISGGVNVDPLEVEGVLAAHPAVREAVVVGLPHDEWGESVSAAVEVAVEVGTEGGGELEASLAAFCRRRLSGPKRPRRWRFLTALPRTPTGKPDRDAVRRLLAREADGRG